MVLENGKHPQEVRIIMYTVHHAKCMTILISAICLRIRDLTLLKPMICTYTYLCSMWVFYNLCLQIQDRARGIVYIAFSFWQHFPYDIVCIIYVHKLYQDCFFS